MRRVAIGLAGVAAAIFVYRCFKKKSGSLHDGIVSQLFVHPICGVQGFSPAKWPLVKSGLLFDREWAVVLPADLEAVSSSKFPKLATARAVADPYLSQLTVTAPGKVPLVVNFAEERPRRELSVSRYGTKCRAVEEDINLSRWFSELIGQECLVVRAQSQRSPSERAAHKVTTCDDDRTCFQSFSTLHAICEEGVEWLRQNVSDGSPVEASQFRANIVVSRVPFPEEDRWSELTIGHIRMRVARQTSRCVIPTHDSQGQRNKAFEPTATIRRFRSAYHRHMLNNPDKVAGPMFGVDIFHSHAPDQAICVGDVVHITQTRDPPQYIPQA